MWREKSFSAKRVMLLQKVSTSTLGAKTVPQTEENDGLSTEIRTNEQIWAFLLEESRSKLPHLSAIDPVPLQ